jgi:hypothetical protein
MADDTKPPVSIESIFSARTPEGGWDSSAYKSLGGAAGLEKALRDAPPPPSSTEVSPPSPPPPPDDRPARLAVPRDFSGYMEARARLLAEHEIWLDKHDARRSSYKK